MRAIGIDLGGPWIKGGLLDMETDAGVGGTLLLNGKLYQGHLRKAGHLGHLTVDADGDADITGIPGSLKDAIGNATITKRSLGRFTSTYQLLEAYRRGDPFSAGVAGPGFAGTCSPSACTGT